MQFAIHDASGTILRLVTLGPNKDPANQCAEGEAYVEMPDGFTGNDLTHRIEDGEPVPV